MRAHTRLWCTRSKRAVHSPPKQRSSLLIISYESAHIYIEELLKHNFDLVVCDEAHRLKNQKTKVRACGATSTRPAARCTRVHALFTASLARAFGAR